MILTVSKKFRLHQDENLCTLQAIKKNWNLKENTFYGETEISWNELIFYYGLWNRDK